MNELVELSPASNYPMVPVAAIKERMMAIKELAHDVLKKNVHYGSVTGPEGKPSLWKPGAELLCTMFRISWRFEVEDLSTTEYLRYRIRCTGLSPAGEVLGDGMGECSTAEEKYRWRKAAQEEFDAAPEMYKRIKYARGRGGSAYKVFQVAVQPLELGNTILKMGCKRAHVAMTLGVTGCSDEFTQDLDDDTTGGGSAGPADDEPPPLEPRPKSAGTDQSPPRAESARTVEDLTGERNWILGRIKETGRDLAPLLEAAGIKSLDKLTRESFAMIREQLRKA